MQSNHLIFSCLLLLLLCLFQLQGPFKWVGPSHQVAKLLEIQHQHQPFQWIFRVDFFFNWLVWSPWYPETLKNLFQNHTSKASILQHSAFFMVQHSHMYMTSGKTIALTVWTFVILAKWCLCFLIRCLDSSKLFFQKIFPTTFFLPKTFLPRNQMPFNLMAAVTICSDFGNLENKICHCFQISPCVCHEVLGLDALILVFWMSSFKPSFSLSSCTFTKRLFSSSSLSNIRVVSSTYMRLLILILAIMWMNQFYDLQIIFIVFTYRWLVNLTFKSCFLCVIFFSFLLCVFLHINFLF